MNVHLLKVPLTQPKFSVGTISSPSCIKCCLFAEGARLVWRTGIRTESILRSNTVKVEIEVVMMHRNYIINFCDDLCIQSIETAISSVPTSTRTVD